MKKLILVACLLLLPVLAWAMFGSRGVVRIRTLPLPAPNPVSWTFAVPLPAVRTKVFELFTSEHQHQDPPFGELPGPPLPFDSLSIEGADQPLSDNNVSTDLYLHNYHSPLLVSPVYFGDEGGLTFYANFRLRLMSDGTGTTVIVAARNCQVLNGTRFGAGPCVVGQLANFDAVAPTTVEEYALLRYLGRHLGITDMPALRLPAQ